MSNSSKKDFFKFAFGFVAMISLGFVMLLGIGFYQVEIAGNNVSAVGSK
jgi:hypothetical protein